MSCCDRSLQLVGAFAVQSFRALEQPDALGDLHLIPARSVLMFERHELAGVVDPGAAARVMQHHEGE